MNAAVRFTQAIGKQTSHIKNSVIANGLGKGIEVKSSNHITIENTAVVGFRALGIEVQTVRNFTLTGSLVFDISKRGEFTSVDHLVDTEACVTVCAIKEGDKCSEFSITNNIVGGCVYAGFVVPGHECDEAATQTVFRNNVAHSSDRVGAHIFPFGSSQAKCYEASYFSAYKTIDPSVSSMYKSLDARYKHMTLVDSEHSFSLQSGQSGDLLKLYAEDIHIYGESSQTPNDCPSNALDCWCNDKNGFMLSGGAHNKKDPHILGSSALPCYKFKSEAAWGPTFEGYEISFYNFRATTRCGARQYAIANNPTNSDYVPRHTFSRTYFVNMDDAAIAYLPAPPQNWAVIDDCGEFPCTAPSNIVLDFTNSVIDGGSFSAPSSFQIVSDLPDQITSFERQVIFEGLQAPETYAMGCRFKEVWNAWTCTNRNIGVLLFESLDGDTYDRSVQPIVITNTKGYYNVINSMMDHVWDGFYTG